MTASRFAMPDILEERLPGFGRALLTIGGLIALLAPVIELSPGVFPLNLASPVFLAIIVGTAFVGLPMVLAGAADVGQRWTLESHVLRIQFLAIAFGREVRLHRSNGVSARIAFDDEAPAHAAHRIELKDAHGKCFVSPPFRTHAEADAYLSRVKAKLGL